MNIIFQYRKQSTFFKMELNFDVNVFCLPQILTITNPNDLVINEVYYHYKKNLSGFHRNFY